MKFLILDRDGAMNEDSPSLIRSTDAWRPLPGSINAITRLLNPGSGIVVATKQSGLTWGLFGLVVRRGDNGQAVCESSRACGP